MGKTVPSDLLTGKLHNLQLSCHTSWLRLVLSGQLDSDWHAWSSTVVHLCRQHLLLTPLTIHPSTVCVWQRCSANTTLYSKKTKRHQWEQRRLASTHNWWRQRREWPSYPITLYVLPTPEGSPVLPPPEVTGVELSIYKLAGRVFLHRREHLGSLLTELHAVYSAAGNQRLPQKVINTPQKINSCAPSHLTEIKKKTKQKNTHNTFLVLLTLRLTLCLQGISSGLPPQKRDWTLQFIPMSKICWLKTVQLLTGLFTPLILLFICFQCNVSSCFHAVSLPLTLKYITAVIFVGFYEFNWLNWLPLRDLNFEGLSIVRGCFTEKYDKKKII